MSHDTSSSMETRHLVGPAGSPSLHDRFLHHGHNTPPAVSRRGLPRGHALLGGRSLARLFRSGTRLTKLALTFPRGRDRQFRKCRVSNSPLGNRQPACAAAFPPAPEIVAPTWADKRKARVRRR